MIWNQPCVSKSALCRRSPLAALVCFLAISGIASAAANGGTPQGADSPTIAGVRLGMTEHDAAKALHDFDPTLAIHVVAEPSYAYRDKEFDGAIVAEVEGYEAINHPHVVVVWFTEFGGRVYEIVRYKEHSDQEEPVTVSSLQQAVKASYGISLEKQEGRDILSASKVFGTPKDVTESALCRRLVDTKGVYPSFIFEDSLFARYPADISDRDGRKFQPISDGYVQPWNGPIFPILPSGRGCGPVLEVEAGISVLDRAMVSFVRQHVIDPEATAQEFIDEQRASDKVQKAEHDHRVKIGNQSPKL